MSPRTHPCALHRAALLDFVEARSRSTGQPEAIERGPATAAALRHLDTCERCRRELEEIALTIAALRRLGAETAGQQPSAAAWPRLRTRLERPRTPLWQVRTTLGGLLAGAALVGVVVGGQTWRPVQLGGASSDVVRYAGARQAPSATEIVAERRLLDHSGQPVPPDPGPSAATVSLSLVRWLGPDGLGAPTPTIAKTPPSRAK